ncbi:MAG: MinD/ParA family protein [Deltaproteobacteria bacterium]|nr:MinD/ParA family protein [Deltaproteobacteria bacterium]
MEENMDQAGTLRTIVNQQEKNEGPIKQVKVIAVTSGKGGVGKTNIVANLAYTLSAVNRKRVMVLDADLGLGNLDILLGLAPEYNLADVIEGRKNVREIVLEGPGGIKILPAGSGIQTITELGRADKANLLTQIDELEEEIDFLLIDTAAGISSNVMFFNVAAQEILVVASPEPTSITDAYALMKVMSQEYAENHFKLLINSVKNEAEAKGVYKKLCTVADRFLNISIDYFGFVVTDPVVTRSVRQQKAIAELFPGSPASLCFRSMANSLLESSDSDGVTGNIQFFWKRIFQIG